MQRILFFEENKPVGKTDNRTATTDGTDDCNERVGIAKSQHIDIIGDYQKQANQGDYPYLLDRLMILDLKSMIFKIFDKPDDEHHESLVEGIIDLDSIVVITAHKVFVVQTGAGTNKYGEREGDVVTVIGEG